MINELDETPIFIALVNCAICKYDYESDMPIKDCYDKKLTCSFLSLD